MGFHKFSLTVGGAVDRAGPKGPLHGIPVGFKDVIETADLPTAYGSPIYPGFRPGADAACVALVRAAGGVVLGKTVTTLALVAWHLLSVKKTLYCCNL